MRFSLAFSALSAATLVLAQGNPVIQVGSTEDDPNGGIYRFIPSTLNNITNGTTITFRFTGAPGNHSVTQSTFADPCDPFDGGFDSGWVNIPANNVSTSPEWNLTITDATAPIWFFCKQLVPGVHCSLGMVGAINPPLSGNTFAAFQTNANQHSGASGQEEGSLVGLVASASTGPGPAVSGASFYTAVQMATAIAPSSPSSSANASTSAGGDDTGASGGNGALSMTANLLVVTLGVIVGSSLCFV